jgi:hypothetical protein
VINHHLVVFIHTIQVSYEGFRVEPTISIILPVIELAGSLYA